MSYLKRKVLSNERLCTVRETSSINIARFLADGPKVLNIDRFDTRPVYGRKHYFVAKVSQLEISSVSRELLRFLED